MYHIIPIHKKDDKHSLNNYRPVSFLPICGKIFEKTIFNDRNPSLEVRCIFLDISKAFDKVGHEGLLYKLENFGILRNLLKLLQSFLSDTQQRVVFNGQHSKWAPVQANVLQGSMLGPLLFLIYVNDLPENLEPLAKLFPDDTSLFSTVYDLSESANLSNDDLKKNVGMGFQMENAI